MRKEQLEMELRCSHKVFLNKRGGGEEKGKISPRFAGISVADEKDDRRLKFGRPIGKRSRRRGLELIR